MILPLRKYGVKSDITVPGSVLLHPVDSPPCAFFSQYIPLDSESESLSPLGLDPPPCGGLRDDFLCGVNSAAQAE